MNRHAYRLTQRLGFNYCSDMRGTHPFIPIQNAEIIACPQLPTTLPTLDELIGLDGLTPDNVAERVLELSSAPTTCGHVYTLHAELEGMKLAPVFERLLEGWRNAVSNSFLCAVIASRSNMSRCLGTTSLSAKCPVAPARSPCKASRFWITCCRPRSMVRTTAPERPCAGRAFTPQS